MSTPDPPEDVSGRLFTDVVAATLAAGWSLAVAESLTGGMLGYLLSREPGAGEVLTGSLVTYRSSVKHGLLGVPPGPVVSEAAARVMAESARRLLDADLAVSLTGVAGPSTQDGMPVGTVFIGVAAVGRPTVVSEHHLPGEPDDVRVQACRAAGRRLLGSLRG